MIGGRRKIADPAQTGWWRPIEDSDLARLTIPTSTALAEGCEFNIICANTPPDNYNELSGMELQILVDMDGLDVPRGRSGKRRGRRSVGAAATFSASKIDAKAPQMVRCRMCGWNMALSGSSVEICPHCGKAQAISTGKEDVFYQQIRCAEDHKLGGDFHEAERILKRAAKDDPGDADLHWSLMLCKYEVSYYEDPRTGRRLPRVGNPCDAPVSSDPDCLRALELADDSQWAAYKNQLVLLEAARTKTIEDAAAVQEITARVKQKPDETSPRHATSEANGAEARETEAEARRAEAEEDFADSRHSGVVADMIKRLRK